MKFLKTVSIHLQKNGNLYFYAFVFLLIAFRVWLIAGVPKLLMYMPHDDLYYAKAAHFILHGEWLGPYSNMTLIKGPFYAFFLIASSLTGLPLLLNETLFYVVSCVVLFVALKPLINNRWWRLLIFTILLYCPMTLATEWTLRVYREFVYFSLTLFVTAFAIGLLLRIRSGLKTLVFWAAGLGLSMGAFLITREEGAWIIPMILFIMAAGLFIIWKKEASQKICRSLTLLLSILLWFIPTVLVSFLNYHYYGFWGVTEQMDKDFSRVLNSIYRIKSDEKYPYRYVNQDMLDQAYLASPLFAELEESIAATTSEWLGHSNYSIQSKPGWYLEEYFSNKGSYLGTSHFPWQFRDALAENGYYSSGVFPREQLDQMADEIEAACENGTLQCTNNINIPFIGSLNKQQIGLTFRFFVDDTYRLITYNYPSLTIHAMNVADWSWIGEEQVYLDEFVNNPLNTQNSYGSSSETGIVGGHTDVRFKMVYIKHAIMKFIFTIYKYSTIIFIGLILAITIALIIKKKLKNKNEESSNRTIILVFLTGLMCFRLLLLAVLDASTTISSQYYISSVYIFLYLLVFMVFNSLVRKTDLSNVSENDLIIKKSGLLPNLLILCIGIGYLLLFVPTIFSEHLNLLSDASVFNSVFSLINRGDRLYIDFFDHKDPIFYYTYSLFFYLFNTKGPMIWETLISFLDIVFLFLILRKLSIGYISKIITILLFCCINFLPSIYYPLHTYHQAILFFLITVFLLLQNKKCYIAAIAGIFCTGMIFTRFPMVVVVPIFLLYLFLTRDRKDRRIFAFLGGILGGLLLLVGILAIRGELPGYIDAFILNLQYSDALSLTMGNMIELPTMGQQLQNLLHGLVLVVWIVLVLINLYLLLRYLITAYSLNKRTNRISVVSNFFTILKMQSVNHVAESGILLSLLSLLLSAGILIIFLIAPYWPHYYQIVSLSICFLFISVSMHFEWKNVSRYKIIGQLLIQLMVIILPVTLTVKFFPRQSMLSLATLQDNEVLIQQVNNELRDRVSNDKVTTYSVLSQTENAWFPMATPDNYTLQCRLFFQFPFFSQKLITEFTDCLGSKKPDLIFVAPYAIPMDDSYIGRIDSILADNYVLVDKIEIFDVWQKMP